MIAFTFIQGIWITQDRGPRKLYRSRHSIEKYMNAGKNMGTNTPANESTMCQTQRKEQTYKKKHYHLLMLIAEILGVYSEYQGLPFNCYEDPARGVSNLTSSRQYLRFRWTL